MQDEIKKLGELFLDDDKNLRAVMDVSPVMLWLTEKTLTVYLNKSWLDFTGRPLNKELGKGWLEGVHGDDIAVCNAIIPPAFHSQIPYEIEYRLRHHSGVYKWILEQGTPVFSQDGTFRGYVGGCVDIDNQKRIELQLRSSEERYRRLFETARDGVLILDSQTGEITDVNPFLEQLLGYSKEEFLGKKLWEVGAFKNTKASKETFKLLQDTGYVRYEDLPLETKDGRQIEVEFVSNAYKAGEERVMQCNIRDISERKRVEMADKALLFLEQEKSKTKFISEATHELRTPLAIIKGNVDLALRDKNKEVSPLETFRAINVEINHLAGMLSDLTTLTTTTGDHDFYQKVIKQKINLSKLVPHIVERCKTIAVAKNVTLSTKETPDVTVLGDKIYLEKLFTNIISNAIFYGKKNGSVTLNIKKNKDHAIITIVDNGIGINKKDIPNIFDRFYRAESARTINHEGTGLGLAISKWIVEAHQGSIEVTSVVEKGTTFTINLPLFK